MSISTGTIIRTCVLVVALINQVLTMTGRSVLPFDEQQITDGLSMLFTVAAALWAWWKNNSFTSEAKEADVYLKERKAEK